jgi:hypothetical protein
VHLRVVTKLLLPERGAQVRCDGEDMCVCLLRMYVGRRCAVKENICVCMCVCVCMCLFVGICVDACLFISAAVDLFY